jgi:hypothetical protein
MKKTLNRLTPSTSDSDSDTDSGSESESERSSHQRALDLNTVVSQSESAAATAGGSPVGDSLRKLGSRPSSPMTREKLQAVLQEAIDIIDDDVEDSELDFGKGVEQ